MPRIALDEARGGMQGRLTRMEAASYLGVAPSTMADWHRKGIGPASVKVGGRRFYRTSALDSFISRDTR